MQRIFAFLALVIFPFTLLAFTVPERPSGFVQDYAGMLTSQQVSDLETKLENYEKNTTNEIAVVTIPSLDGDTIENVAQEIFTKWGIGKKGKDNGVLLIISLADRKTRIHTGYGVEGFLTDIGTSYIQSDIIRPAFRDNNYYVGINSAVDKMIEALASNNIVPEDYSNSNAESGSKGGFGVILYAFFIFFVQIFASIFGRSKSWWGGGVFGGVVGMVVWHYFIDSTILAIPSIIILILFGLFLDYIVSNSYSRAGVNLWESVTEGVWRNTPVTF
jgi:uncharacterized protein